MRDSGQGSNWQETEVRTQSGSRSPRRGFLGLAAVLLCGSLLTVGCGGEAPAPEPAPAGAAADGAKAPGGGPAAAGADGAAAADGAKAPGDGPAAAGADGEEIPTVTNVADLFTQYDGKEVIIEGTYARVDIRNERTEPPQLTHAVVRLDGGGVAIEPRWSEHAVRADGEGKFLEGKKIQIRGIFNADKKPPKDMKTDQKGPHVCISPVKAMKPLDEE